MQTYGDARPNLAQQVKQRPSNACGRLPLADDDLVQEIKAIICEKPAYLYHRVHAILRRKARGESRLWPNAERIYRVHCLLLQRHTGAIEGCRHDGRVAVAHSNQRWCPDDFEIGCDNTKKLRFAFVFDRVRPDPRL